MPFSLCLVVFLTFVLSAAAQSNSCPGGRIPDQTITATNGIKFAVCLNTDFKGGDITNSGNVQTIEQLISQCSQITDCSAATRAKNTASGWYKRTTNVVGTSNSGCDSIYRIPNPVAPAPPPQNTNICAAKAGPSRVITTSNGAQFGVCLNTDFKSGDSVTSPIRGITSVEMLAEDCSKRAGCVGASREKRINGGWPKSVLNSAVSNSGVDAVFKLLDPVPSGTTTTVPSSTSTAVTSSAVSSASSSASSTLISSSFVSSSSSSSATGTSSATSSTGSSSVTGPSTPSASSTLSSISSVTPISTSFSPSSSLSSSPSSSLSSSISSSSTVSPSMSSTSSSIPLPTVCAGGKTPSRIIVTTLNQYQFGVCENTDFRGGDLTNGLTGISSLEQLAEDCAARPTCIGASRSKWYSSGWPKSLLNAPEVNTNVDSIVKINTSAPLDPQDKAGMGSWGAVIKFPVIPAGVFVVTEKPRNTRLLLFAAYTEQTFGNGNNGRTQFAEYNLESGAVSKRTISNTQHDMFCPGISTLQDGRVVITGGSNAERTSIYDPSTNSFVPGPNMQMARGYQSSVTLSSGKVFTLGGSWSGGITVKDGEVYDPATNLWTKLPGALVRGAVTQDAGIDKRDNHHWFFGWRDNSIFQAGPSKQMNWFSAGGTGSVQTAGIRDSEDAMCGIFVMYDAIRGKILTAGGAPNYHDNAPNKKAHHITISAPGTAPVVQRLPDMAFPRAFANAAVLPDGKVLITGGQTFAKAFTDENSILIPELFDPANMTFRQLAPMKVPRNYHSTSLLLPDGRVFTGGGGLCHDIANTCPGINSNHPDGEIFSPPYLFNSDGSDAVRPVITDLSSDTAATGYSVRAGGTLTVTVGQAQQGMTFAMLRVGSNTHSVNTDQRRVPLEDIQQSGSQYVLTVPSDNGIMIPGDWYLFVLSAQGTPSVSRSVTVML